MLSPSAECFTVFVSSGPVAWCHYHWSLRHPLWRRPVPFRPEVPTQLPTQTPQSEVHDHRRRRGQIQPQPLSEWEGLSEYIGVSGRGMSHNFPPLSLTFDLLTYGQKIFMLQITDTLNLYRAVALEGKCIVLAWAERDSTVCFTLL
jgi:hypothetical protein